MADESFDQKWEQSIVPIRVHINLWVAAAVVVGLLQFKATGSNPPEFYVQLRWLTFLVTAFGLWVALDNSFFGLMLVLGSIAALYNPMFPFHMNRSSWFSLNILSGTALIASAVLLRWKFLSKRRAPNG